MGKRGRVHDLRHAADSSGRRRQQEEDDKAEGEVIGKEG